MARNRPRCRSDAINESHICAREALKAGLLVQNRRERQFLRKLLGRQGFAETGDWRITCKNLMGSKRSLEASNPTDNPLNPTMLFRGRMPLRRFRP